MFQQRSLAREFHRIIKWFSTMKWSFIRHNFELISHCLVPFFFFFSWFQTCSVLQALEFDLIVYPPYRPLEGFINDMEVRLVKPFWASSFIICTRKSSSLGFCLFLDLCFLPYPVTAIAIVGNKIRIYRISAK